MSTRSHKPRWSKWQNIFLQSFIRVGKLYSKAIWWQGRWLRTSKTTRAWNLFRFGGSEQRLKCCRTLSDRKLYVLTESTTSAWLHDIMCSCAQPAFVPRCCWCRCWWSYYENMTVMVVVVITSMMIKKRYSAIQSQKQTNHLSSHVSISPCSIGLLPGWTPSNGARKLRPRLWQCMSLFALAKQEPWLTGHIFANGCLWILDDSRPPIPTKSHQRSYRII